MVMENERNLSDFTASNNPDSMTSNNTADTETSSGSQMDPSEQQMLNNSRANFPLRLYHMLFDAENNNRHSIISWQPHGRCFKVHDKDEFVKNLLPVWFHMKTYASFLRQLNMYGFQRITNNLDKGGYWHVDFIRGQVQQVYWIARIPRKGCGPRKPDSVIETPDFWKMGAALEICAAQSPPEVASELPGSAAVLAPAEDSKPSAVLFQPYQHDRQDEQPQHARRAVSDCTTTSTTSSVWNGLYGLQNSSESYIAGHSNTMTGLGRSYRRPSTTGGNGEGNYQGIFDWFRNSDDEIIDLEPNPFPI